MKSINLSLFVFLLVVSCTSDNHSQRQSAEIASSIKVGKSVSNCIDYDTLIKENGFFIKYIQNTDTALFINRDTTFDIIIGKNNWSKKLGFGFNCETPKNIIPSYKWSSDKVVALSRNCGNFCSVDFFYQPYIDSTVTRNNVLCFNKRSNLISYIVKDTLFIEDIVAYNKKGFAITDSIPCSAFITCIDDIHFNNNDLHLKWRTLRNKKEVLVNRIFHYSK